MRTETVALHPSIFEGGIALFLYIMLLHQFMQSCLQIIKYTKSSVTSTSACCGAINKLLAQFPAGFSTTFSRLGRTYLNVLVSRYKPCFYTLFIDFQQARSQSLSRIKHIWFRKPILVSFWDPWCANFNHLVVYFWGEIWRWTVFLIITPTVCLMECGILWPTTETSMSDSWFSVLG